MVVVFIWKAFVFVCLFIKIVVRCCSSKGWIDLKRLWERRLNLFLSLKIVLAKSQARLLSLFLHEISRVMILDEITVNFSLESQPQK